MDLKKISLIFGLFLLFIRINAFEALISLVLSLTLVFCFNKLKYDTFNKKSLIIDVALLLNSYIYIVSFIIKEQVTYNYGLLYAGVLMLLPIIGLFLSFKFINNITCYLCLTIRQMIESSEIDKKVKKFLIISATYHVFAVVIVKYVIEIDTLYYLDSLLMLLNICLGSLCYIDRIKQKKLNIDDKLLISFVLLYLISTVVNIKLDDLWKIEQWKKYIYNVIYLLLIVYPLFKYASKKNFNFNKYINIVNYIWSVVLFVIFIKLVFKLFPFSLVRVTWDGPMVLLGVNANSNNTAMVEMVFLLLTTYSLINSNKKLEKIALSSCLVVHYCILVLSNSRASYYSMLVALMVIVFILIKSKTNNLIYSLLGCVTLFFILKYARIGIVDIYKWKTDEHEIESATRSIISGSNNDVSSGRLEIWKTALTSFITNIKCIFIGVSSNYTSNLFIDPNTGISKIAYTHNQFIEVLCNTGIFGFVIYTVWLIKNGCKIFINFFKTKDINYKVLSMIIAAILAANLVEAKLVYTYFFVNVAFFAIFGYLVGKCD